MMTHYQNGATGIERAQQKSADSASVVRLFVSGSQFERSFLKKEFQEWIISGLCSGLSNAHVA